MSAAGNGLRPRPRFADLPVRPGDPPGTAWGLYGDDDDLGAMNLLTADRTASAAALVRTGQMFRLDLPLDEPSPNFFSREPMRHEVFNIAATSLDDRLDNFFPQGSTQWDALSHVSHAQHGFYNGLDEAAVRAGRLCIDHIARRGIATRGVLADLAPLIDPSSDVCISVQQLDDVLRAQDVTLQTGDVLCLRTGWIGWFLGLSPERKQIESDKSRTRVDWRLPGVGPGDEWAEYLWDHGVAMVATDTPMVEPWPIPKARGGMLHITVMVNLGIPLGEFFDFEALAGACADDHVYEFMFVSAPIYLPKGIGSPGNAIAIK